MQNTNADLDLTQITIYAIIGLAIVAILILSIIVIAKQLYVPYVKSIKKLLKNKWFWIIVSAVFVIFVYIFFLSPSNAQYYKKWIECGRPPVEIRMQGMFGVGTYYYTESKALEIYRYSPSDGDKYYFCTPHDAELRGYSANENQYEFRHTTAEERVEYRDSHNDSILYK